jgi:hypothetical protein
MFFVGGAMQSAQASENDARSLDALMSEYTPTAQFYIKQAPLCRAFHIYDKNQYWAIAVSSKYGIIDFYDTGRICDKEHYLARIDGGCAHFDFHDKCKEKQWVNHYDALYDNAHHRIARIQFAYEKEPFWERKNLFQRSKKIELFSNQSELLATFDQEADCPEKGEGTFVFRHPVTGEPLAFALWKWDPPVQWHHYLQVHEIDHQEWSVSIVDAEYLRSKNIHLTILAWVLLKHSQCHLRGPLYDLPYEFVRPSKS